MPNGTCPYLAWRKFINLWIILSSVRISDINYLFKFPLKAQPKSSSFQTRVRVGFKPMSQLWQPIELACKLAYTFLKCKLEAESGTSETRGCTSLINAHFYYLALTIRTWWQLLNMLKSYPGIGMPFVRLWRKFLVWVTIIWWNCLLVIFCSIVLEKL